MDFDLYAFSLLITYKNPRKSQSNLTERVYSSGENYLKIDINEM